MSRLRTIAESLVAGVVSGSLVGLTEVAWLWSQSGVDLALPPWGVGLYGAAGGAVGFGVGVAFAAAFGQVPRLKAWAGGASAIVSLLAVGGVVGRYVLNRDLFAEQGVPVWALAVMAGGLLVVGGGAAAVWARGLGTLGRKKVLPPVALGWALAFLLSLGLSAGFSAGDRFDPTLPTSASPSQPASKESPNVLFILVDTLRADHLDHPTLNTPHLDRLRGQSVTFDNAWSAASWTRPGVASLWTSRSPANHTATGKGSRLPEQVVTWAEALQARGVRTGALVNNINVTESFGFNQGFDTFHYEAPAYPFGATEGVFNLALYKVLHRVEERVTGGGSVERYYAPATAVFEHADQWIQARGEEQWALSVHLMEPHDPYFDAEGDGFSRAENPSPAEALGPSLVGRYGLEVERLDAALGPFLDTLKSSGKLEHTLIVLTSDHGEEFFEHGGWWHGTSLYAEQTQVPLVFALPAGELAGERADWQVRSIDVAPTIARILGAEPDPSWEGRDLFGPDEVDFIASQEAQRNPRPEPAVEPGEDPVKETADEPPAAVPAAQSPAQRCRALRSHALDRVVLMEQDFEGNRIQAVRTSGFSLHLAEPGGSRELPERAMFDVVADPGEQADLLGGGAAICSKFPDDWAQDLTKAMQLVRDASGQGLEASEVEVSPAQRAQLCALGYLTGKDCP
ncbi:MAG: sulfatase [Myxococcota bacterium]